MNINPTLNEWLSLIARWVHVFAGIMWVGTTYYFTWLDARLSEEEKAVRATGSSAQLWMVHSGGFYVVEKRKVPDELSRKLHWFRWEAGTTWLSGMALLVIVYYLGGGALIDRDVADISLGAAVGIGVGSLVFGWLIYDLLMIRHWDATKKLRVGGLCFGRGLRIRTFTPAERSRRIHPHRRNFRHNHGRKRVDAYPAGAAKNDRGYQGGSEAR